MLLWNIITRMIAQLYLSHESDDDYHSFDHDRCFSGCWGCSCHLRPASSEYPAVICYTSCQFQEWKDPDLIQVELLAASCGRKKKKKKNWWSDCREEMSEQKKRGEAPQMREISEVVKKKNMPYYLLVSLLWALLEERRGGGGGAGLNENREDVLVILPC